MFEPEPEEIWREWKDGDDTALYDQGYYDGIQKTLDIINNVLEQEQVDRIPASWLLKVIRHTIQAGD
jgi:hypothetical protein